MRRARDRSAIRAVAWAVPMLAAVPAAYFVGRSTYYHLVLKWSEAHVAFWPWLGAAVAVVAGVVVEGLGTVSLYLWSSFDRWNRARATREDGTLKRGYDKAPAGLALAAFGGYVAAVVVLLVVLEAAPAAAGFAPVVFPVMTAVGGLCWSLYDQHRDRLAYHGLAWNWVAVRQREEREGRPEPAPDLDPADRAILDAYRRDPAASYAAVAAAVGSSKTTVGTRFKDLERAGLAERGPDGVRVLGSGNGERPR